MQCLTSARGRLRSLVANCTEEELAELRTDVEEQSSVGQALQAMMANNVSLQELMARYQKEASESKDLANKVRRAGIPRLVWRRDSLMHPHSEIVFTLHILFLPLQRRAHLHFQCQVAIALQTERSLRSVETGEVNSRKVAQACNGLDGSSQLLTPSRRIAFAGKDQNAARSNRSSE
jgi:hypothetical protein